MNNSVEQLKPFQSISPEELIHSLSEHQHSLILDIRSAAQFSRSHLKNSINLNLPSTLLRRPLYGPDKSEERQRFQRYKTPSTDPSNGLQLIIVIDHDSRFTNPNHPLTLLLNKFSPLVALSTQLVWLNGGYQALLNLAQPDWSNKFITTSSPSSQEHQDPFIKNDQLKMSLSFPLPLTASLPTPPAHPLPPAGSHPHNPTQPASHSKSRRVHMSLSMLSQGNTSSLNKSPISPNSTLGTNTPACYPLTSSSHSNHQPALSHHQHHSNHPKSLSSKSNSSSILNPFFDNIRQLNERLSLSSSLQNLSPIELPLLTDPLHDLPRLPPFLRRLLQDSPLKRAQRLAHEFHDLEMAEQHRLEDVMRWESNRSAASLSSYFNSSPSISASQPSLTGQQPHSKAQEGSLSVNRHHHPFSISAGVELGYKNRYKNIWPYEHARIRLRPAQTRRNDTDYMNASMISFRSDGAPAEMRSTKVDVRKYIATQGPLTSTFEDFWSVVGQEDVGIIIMITRRHEAGREKCADYLRNGQYGDMVVSVDHRNKHDGGPGGIESDGDEERDMASGFFGFPSVPPLEEQPPVIEPQPKPTNRPKGGVLRKMVRLSRTTRPDLPARQIAHIQYRGWPDFDVPPAAEEVLDLIAVSQRAAEEIQLLNSRAIDEYTRGTPGEDPAQVRKTVGSGAGPVIVHCSAGVGRTGSFILLDVMIEVLKAQYVTATLHSSSPRLPNPQSPQSNNCPNTPKEHSSNTLPIEQQPQPQPQDQLRHSALPRFLDSQLCDCRAMIAPIWQTYPIMAVVNEMRFVSKPLTMTLGTEDVDGCQLSPIRLSSRSLVNLHASSFVN
ncbi:hypothetical protein VP01_554g5 [Puccinia sorghi]|uniref:protein-tyrosine-phosphatase n=1 Tax=Puccinia sorghi TaxID=27349 RepID=A0A0L6UL94_9BASI|nr:hypothetical protein VP01_554g5 [Puccinia sorghi]